MKRSVSITIICLLLFATGARSIASSSELRGSIERYTSHLRLRPEQLQSITERQVVVRSLSTKNDKEIAALGIVMADATPDAFVQSYRSLATFQQNPYIEACGMFSEKPSISDLDKLTFEEDDLYALAESKAGDSEIKLSKSEIAKLSQVAPRVARLTPAMKSRLSSEFKRLLVERVKIYCTNSASGLGIYADKEDQVNGQDAFVAISREQAEGSRQCGHLSSYLESFPENTPPESESFIYWAKQRFGDLKPVINIVHVMIHKDGGRVYLASKQIYSTHYTEAGLTVAELIPFTDADALPRTLVIYTLRIQVDMLGGALGFMKKRMAQPKVLATLKQSLNAMRATMESAGRVTVNNSTALK